jgi:hypothetical protein
LRSLLRLRLIRSASNVLLIWVRPSFFGFWLVLQRITLTGGKRSILQLRLQRIALTYRIQPRFQRIALSCRKIGILLGLRRS